HRNLHPFPTRRSSDLTTTVALEKSSTEDAGQVAIRRRQTITTVTGASRHCRHSAGRPTSNGPRAVPGSRSGGGVRMRPTITEAVFLRLATGTNVMGGYVCKVPA